MPPSTFRSRKKKMPGFTASKDRVKPWGPGHAIYVAREYIKGPFAVINADDFYGYDAYEILIDFRF